MHRAADIHSVAKGLLIYSLSTESILLNVLFLSGYIIHVLFIVLNPNTNVRLNILWNEKFIALHLHYYAII